MSKKGNGAIFFSERDSIRNPIWRQLALLTLCRTFALQMRPILETTTEMLFTLKPVTATVARYSIRKKTTPVTIAISNGSPAIWLGVFIVVFVAALWMSEHPVFGWLEVL